MKLPTLGKGEINAGIVFNNGAPSHWLILLPGEAKAVTWKSANEWAEKQGGELPTRKEQSLLFANAAAAFQHDWYWSGEQYAGVGGYAWGQTFLTGFQSYITTNNELRARAVRRIPIGEES